MTTVRLVSPFMDLIDSHTSRQSTWSYGDGVDRESPEKSDRTDRILVRGGDPGLEIAAHERTCEVEVILLVKDRQRFGAIVTNTLATVYATLLAVLYAHSSAYFQQVEPRAPLAPPAGQCSGEILTIIQSPL
jgi:hypothetical protein